MNMVEVTFPAGTVTVGADECVIVTGVADSIAEGMVSLLMSPCLPSILSTEQPFQLQRLLESLLWMMMVSIMREGEGE